MIFVITTTLLFNYDITKGKKSQFPHQRNRFFAPRLRVETKYFGKNPVSA